MNRVETPPPRVKIIDITTEHQPDPMFDYSDAYSYCNDSVGYFKRILVSVNISKGKMSVDDAKKWVLEHGYSIDNYQRSLIYYEFKQNDGIPEATPEAVQVDQGIKLIYNSIYCYN